MRVRIAVLTIMCGVGVTILTWQLWPSLDAEAIADKLEEASSQVVATTNYRRLCLPCHGTNGAGDGPAAPWLWPRPRDFSRAQYKWRSTDIGKPPTTADLAQTIRHGVTATSMHGFGDVLSANEIDALARLISRFAPEKFAAPPQVVALGSKPAITGAVLAAGKRGYTDLGCDKCHGAEGKGDGPAAADLKKSDGTPETTYDLSTESFRRPRAADDDPVEMIYRSLVLGLTGTPMPSFRGAASDETIWAVAAYVATLAAPMKTPRNRSISIAPEAAALDTVNTGYWPGTPSDPDAKIWGHSLEVQRAPPASLAPAQASLSAQQCARCHNEQFRDWRSTVHGGASSPGLMAQLVESEHDTDSDQAAFVEGCLRCHSPLAEQAATINPPRWGGPVPSASASDQNEAAAAEGYRANPTFDSALQAEGINCASCHVREWQRHGPPRASGGKLLSLPNYPLERSDFYERSDFCLACHQLAPSNLLGDKPLLNTYVEWLAGPYFAKGIQCQHCHMPNREHTWKGVHDPETFRQGLELEAVTKRDDEKVSVRVRVTNVGAGHYLPTTPTPAAFVEVELLDALGRPIAGARSTQRIGRHIRYDDEKGWIEVEDTRIPPGESIELAAAWQDGQVRNAAEVLVTVRVEPDEYYERMYQGELETDLTARQRSMYETALARAQGAHYTALTRRYPIR